MPRLDISLLGSFQIKLDRSPRADFATDKARALLAYLTVEADRPHRREALAGLLWPDQPERKAGQNLRQALLHLRQALGDNKDETFLCVTRETIQFNRDSDYALDVTMFASLIEACKRHRHRQMENCRSCLNRLEQAVELYRGEFLEHFSLGDSSAFEEWVLLKREWLHRQAVEALACLADYHERRGEWAQARECAWTQITLEPWREEAHRQLMRLLVFDGQRTAALAQYETCRRMLSQELGLEPTADTTALYERIRAGEELASPALRALPSPPTTFVGREKELAELTELLANPDCRLVTLVGPGGIGKSRLALQAAADHIGAFEGGITFVPLAAVSSPDQIVPAIADALGYPFTDRHDPREQLLSYLRKRQGELLLVLDNMEHILQGSELLAEILDRAPNVKLLVASRERLALQEEWVYQVEGLAYPAGQVARAIEDYSAVNLFQQRARQTQQRFSVSEAESPHVVRICQLVEGMPLGVELAAAWVGVRSCQDIAQDIASRLDALITPLRNVPERQRSLRATFEHSWQLLSGAEQAAFIRLSVFRGGFRPEAATPVAGATLPTLSALVNKSLLRCASPNRYELHELLRQYAAEKLDEVPAQSVEAQNHHCEYYATFLQQQECQLHGKSQKQTLEAIRAEIENVRVAWNWAIARRMDRAIEQSLESLDWFYDMRSWFREAEQAFGRAAQALEASPDPDDRTRRLLGRVVSCQGGACFRLGRYERARELLHKSIAIFRRLDEREELAFALIALGHVALYQRGHDLAAQCYEESLALHRERGHLRGEAEALNSLGVVLRERGKYAEAQQALEQALAIGQRLGNRWRISFFLNNLGIVARMRGDYPAAQAHYQASLAIKKEFGDSRGAAISLNNLGNIACAMGEFDTALHYHQASMTICQEIGDELGVARSLNNLGMVAHGQERYAEARRFHEESLAIKQQIGDQRGAIHSFNQLGKAAVKLGEPERARQEFNRALKSAMGMQAYPLALDAVEGIAELFARQKDIERALKLLTLVRHHPASEKHVRDQADRLLAELDLVAPQAEPRPLDEIVQELLAGDRPSS